VPEERYDIEKDKVTGTGQGKKGLTGSLRASRMHWLLAATEVFSAIVMFTCIIYIQ
jgi:hypothetical protein